MRSKQQHPNTSNGSAAFKPFMTEYRGSFKDPTPTKGKYSGKLTKGKTLKPSTAPAGGDLDSPKPKASEAGLLPPLTNHNRNALSAAPAQEVYPSTSLTLPGMMNGGNALEKHQTRRRRILEASAPISGTPMRYNIITGVIIDGEPSSGFKEGRRAFVRTFAHFDAVTNARTPGYNIITGHDGRPIQGGIQLAPIPMQAGSAPLSHNKPGIHSH
eukprot:jgi/Hompol1/3037/HPOL_006336-RA